MANAAAVKMTTYGYELRLVKEQLPGSLRSILSPRAVPRPIAPFLRPKFNEFSIRPDRALTVWQIQHPVEGGGASLAQLSALEQQMDVQREAARRDGRTFEEIREEDNLFAEQAEALSTLQWENPHAFFDKIDVDRSGALSVQELRDALLARGLSEKMAEPILRDFDGDGDDEISRDEWTVGFYKSRLCTVPQPALEDFADLHATGAGCKIPQTELRGINLRQLNAVYKHLNRRCVPERWRNFFKQELEPKIVTLYDLTRYVIRPATFQRQCAYVELVATRAQRPRWFVSHWWGEHIFDFIACLTAHARDRMPNEIYDSPYWVCAYANNQWELEDAISDDPGKTSFHRALRLSMGTVAVLDRAGVIFSRIWCCYEAHVSLVNTRQNYMFDVYTSLGSSGRGVGLTDGMAVGDVLNVVAGSTKKTREDKFPLDLAYRSIKTTLEVAQASVESDRVHILNKMANQPNLNAPPPKACIQYELLNGTLRARFAAAALVRAFASGTDPDAVAMQQEMIRVLGTGSLKHLDLNFDSCPNFTEEIARQIASSLPAGLGQMTLRLNGHGDAFMHALCTHWKYNGGLEKLASLDFEGNALGARGILEMSNLIKRKFLMNLGSLKLDKNNLDDVDIISLCRGLHQGGLPNLSYLSLESNRIGDKGMQAWLKVLKDKDVVPQLDRLILRGNPAAKFHIENVGRALKQRGRGLKQSKAVEEAQSGEKADQRKAARVWEPQGAD